MPANELPSVCVTVRGHRQFGADGRRTVVWVRGDHDLATRANLSASIAEAARVDDADVVVDLSGVTFMDASTIGALVAARNRLRATSRSLSVRAPSPRAGRLLDLCGLARLIDDHPTPAGSPLAPALGSWVDVPAWERGPDAAPAPAADEVPSVPSQEPARVPARRHVEQAESTQHPRAAT